MRVIDESSEINNCGGSIMSRICPKCKTEELISKTEQKVGYCHACYATYQRERRAKLKVYCSKCGQSVKQSRQEALPCIE